MRKINYKIILSSLYNLSVEEKKTEKRCNSIESHRFSNEDKPIFE